jgi:hypothetical protein
MALAAGTRWRWGMGGMTRRDAAEWSATPVRGGWLGEACLVLLCHKLRRMFRGNLRAQHGHRGSIRAIATTILQWTVAIELGMCRWGRSGGAAGSVTAGNGRFREPPGATRSRGGIVSRSEIRNP